MTRLMRTVPLALIGLVAVSACRKKPVETPIPVANDAPVDSSAIRDSLARAQAAADEEARRLAEEAARADMERRMAEARAALTAPIYFEFDAAELNGDARMTLDAKAPVLQANPGLRIRISGHTDSRGSDEYNLALGQRRAAATKAYLVQLGVDASRIEIVSMGEEQPAVTSEDDGAWAQNRRAEFEITAGDMTNPGGGV
jgi:peptidoglycan-associated lipoprotein